MKANKAIVNVLKEGYKLPLYTVPKPAHFNNNKSAITHSDFVSEEIQDLLKTNRITEVNELPHVINPLSVTLQICIYCPPVWTNVSTIYIYKCYKMSCKTLENKRDQNSLLS